MGSEAIQQQLFTLIKSKIASHQSLSDVVCELLGISADSAYRRIRGEKPLSPDELKKLCTTFHISLDRLFNISSGSTLFQTEYLNKNRPDFLSYLKSILEIQKTLAQMPDAKIYVDAKDIPPFYYYGFEMLSTFKFYVWMRFTGQIDSAEPLSFEEDELNKELLVTSKEIMKVHATIPSVEIWNAETINSTLRQIDFYVESGVIKEKKIAQQLLQQLKELVMRLEKQVEFGKKFPYGSAENNTGAEYSFFVNGVFLGDNCMMAEAKGATKVFVSHGILDFMVADDERFVAATKKSFENIMRKSSLISVVNERERVKFFKEMKNKIELASDKFQ